MQKKYIEKILGIPATTLDRTIKTSEHLAQTLSQNKQLKKVERYWESLGPGFTTGAADDDPSGIATYSQAGAKYGFNLLWLAPLSFPLMAVVQEMCARIGLVTGRGLAGNIRRHYKKWVLYTCTVLLFAANTFNIGADLGAMASSTRLLFPNLNFILLVVFFALLSLMLQIFLTYGEYAKYLKWLTLILFSYIFSALTLELNWKQILHSVIWPSLNFSKNQIFLITAVLGTTISPYLFFWQTSQEVEEKILAGQTTIKLRKQEVTEKEIKKMRADVWFGMFFSNLVMFFIIVTCAAVLYANGATNIQTAAEAAAALRPLAGNHAFLLFTVGIVGTGLLAVPVLAGSASYAIAESFGWKEGLYYKLRQASAFYGVIIISMILGLILNFVGLHPIKALIYSAVINGLVAPIILILLIQLSGNKKLMGSYANGPVTSALGWTITVIMILTGIATLVGLFMP